MIVCSWVRNRREKKQQKKNKKLALVLITSTKLVQRAEMPILIMLTYIFIVLFLLTLTSLVIQFIANGPKMCTSNWKWFRHIIRSLANLPTRSIDSLLGGSVGMDGSHQTLNNRKVVVYHLSQWSKTVGGTGGVARGQGEGCEHRQLMNFITRSHANILMRVHCISLLYMQACLQMISA